MQTTTNGRKRKTLNVKDVTLSKLEQKEVKGGVIVVDIIAPL